MANRKDAEGEADRIWRALASKEEVEKHDAFRRAFMSNVCFLDDITKPEFISGPPSQRKSLNESEFKGEMDELAGLTNAGTQSFLTQSDRAPTSIRVQSWIGEDGESSVLHFVRIRASDGNTIMLSKPEAVELCRMIMRAVA